LSSGGLGGGGLGGGGGGEGGGDAAILQMKMYLSSQFWSDQPHEPLMDWL
jgi:hypothetical protein